MVQKGVNIADVEKCCNMSSIRPRWGVKQRKRFSFQHFFNYASKIFSQQVRRPEARNFLSRDPQIFMSHVEKKADN